MTWTDRNGRPLPLDVVFAVQLAHVKQRLGGLGTRVRQHRQRGYDADESAVLSTRTGLGTRRYLDQEVPPR